MFPCRRLPTPDLSIPLPPLKDDLVAALQREVHGLVAEQACTDYHDSTTVSFAFLGPVRLSSSTCHNGTAGKAWRITATPERSICSTGRAFLVALRHSAGLSTARLWFPGRFLLVYIELLSPSTAGVVYLPRNRQSSAISALSGWCSNNPWNTRGRWDGCGMTRPRPLTRRMRHPLMERVTRIE